MAFDRLADQLDNAEILINSHEAAQRLLARLHDLLPPEDVHRELRYRVAVCFLSFTNAQVGLDYAEQGLAYARKAGDRKAEANFHYCRGVFREMGPQPRDALPDYDAGIALARKLEDDHLVADGFTMRGSTLSLLGEQALALRDFLSAQAIYEASGLTNNAVENLINIAAGYRRLDQFGKAAGYLDQAKRNALAHNDIFALYAIAMERAFLALGQGQPAGAMAPLQRALDYARRTGAPGAAGSVYMARADAQNGLGHFEQALGDVQAARTAFLKTGDSSNTGMLALQEGRALAGLGRHQEADARFDQAEAEFSEKNLRYLVELYGDRAANEESLDHPGRALKYLKLKIKADASLARITQAQYATLMGIQFESAQRDLENRKLAAEKALRDQQLASLERVRHWQGLTLLLSGVLVLVLMGLAMRQFRHSRRYRRLAMTDALTGIANRRSIEGLARDALAEARAKGEPLCMLVLDVDHFKAVNDAFGHAAGDAVLLQITQACKDVLRRCDLVGRLGGEEFLMVFPGTSIDVALQIAERLRRQIASLALSSIAVGLKITVSVGVAEADPAADELGDLVRRADMALYRAKDAGRDRVEAA